jgi:YidC/Oxa1 family membrane protein insertase
MKQFFTTILYQPIYNLFIFLLALMPGHNVGLAIIALTLVIRVILYPLKHKSLEAQLKLRDIQPHAQEINKKHKGDRQAQSMAMMQLYKDHEINPAGGCLPQLPQVIILIILFLVFRNGVYQHDLLYPFVTIPEQVSPHFLWIKDMTQRDPWFLLPILAGVAQFLFSRSIMKSQPPVGDPDDASTVIMKQMMYVFPLATVYIGATSPAALSLYWVVGSLIDWYQQEHAMRRINHKKQKSKATVSVRTKRKEKS